MEPWRVTVVDGLNGQPAGFAIVLADGPEEARAAVVDYLANDTAYGKPFEVSAVERHEADSAQVLFLNWGEWPGGWRPEHETPSPA